METVSCIICRRRKIKCDRRPVTCVNCAKFGTPCSYVDTNATSASGSGVGRRTHALAHAQGSSASSASPAAPVAASATTTQAGLLRRRILRSCTACKRAKAKCSGGATCTRCSRRNVECVYDGGRRDADAVTAEMAVAATEPEYSEPVAAVEAYPVRPHPGYSIPPPMTQSGLPGPPHTQPGMHGPQHGQPSQHTQHQQPSQMQFGQPSQVAHQPAHQPAHQSAHQPAPHQQHQPHPYPDRFSHPGYTPPPRLDALASPPVKLEQQQMPTYTANTPTPSFPLHAHPSHPPSHNAPPPQMPHIAQPPVTASHMPQPSGAQAQSTHITQSIQAPPLQAPPPLPQTKPSPSAVDTSSATTPAAVPAPPPVPRWLVAASLPSMDRLRSLIDSYFARIHPLRCLGFLHMPTFHERLRDQQTLYYDSYGLVHAICALAAPFVYASETAGSVIPTGTAEYRFFEAGAGWAATAMMRIFHHIGTPDVESLMTEMLLHEYYLRSGEYAKAFMLSGLVARHIQLLQLNLEYDCNPPRRSSEGKDDPSNTPDEGLPWAIKESRRRLVWCCYLQDAFMECGIDQLRFVNPADIQVQLPCTEDLFVRGKPCITEMLQPGKLLPFVAADVEASSGKAAPAGIGAANLDLRSFYIRAMAIRAKVLKYVKHLKGDIPWSKDPRKSRFLCLDRELRVLEASVPDELRMNPENTAIFRWSGLSGPGGGSGRVGLYFGVHILLAQTFNDLYRVGVANLVFPHHATQWIRTNAPLAFLVECHRMCSTKAAAIASLLEEVWQTDRLSLVDTPYAMHAQVCSSVMVMTMISWQSLCSRQRDQLQQLKQFQAAKTEKGDLKSETEEKVDKTNANLIGPLVDPQMVPVLPIHRRLLESNLTILDFLRCYIKADLYYESAKQALKRFEQLEEAARDSAAAAAAAAAGEPAPAPTEAPQFSLEYILNPLGVYPMARQQARNRHEPQTNPPPASEPTPTPASAGIPSPISARAMDRSSAPVTTPEPSLTAVPVSMTASAPAPMLNVQGMQESVQGMPADNEPTHNMSVGMQGMVPPGYFQQQQQQQQQRSMSIYDANMQGISGSNISDTAVSMDMPMGMMNNVNNVNNVNINNGNMSNVGMNMDLVNMNMGLNLMDTTEGGEQAMFSMWNWESEVPSMDNMGYPTFLEAFQVN